MKFVALLSGGKDSCYNVMKCQQHGHELVCLANLSPPSTFEGEELNSFMYQSAAFNVIPLMAECFEVPICRREIYGQAVNQDLDYYRSENDEVEDLFELLKEVQQKFPGVKGVSCGAIVSNYQRFRVENVCNRLGLTPLTYLWQRERHNLLQEMVDCGIHAVLVKVAGAGLEPYKHLGKSLSELRPTLERLSQRFGLDVCGEGGEYESLVLDCPAFRRKRLEVVSSEVVVDEEDCMVGNLKVRCKVVDKDGDSTTYATAAAQTTLYNQMTVVCDEAAVVAPSIAIGGRSERRLRRGLPSVSMSRDGFGQTALVTPHISTSSGNVFWLSSPGAQSSLAVQAQMREVLCLVRDALASVGATLADIAFVHLYIASTEVFGAVNEEYCKWFGKYPPSRSCVAVPLALGVGVAMDAVFLVGSHQAMLTGTLTTRNVLHVQSMSEWAPLCIGPYSQANSIHDALIFVAGQIPLDPAIMTLLTRDAHPNNGEEQFSLVRAQLALACRHAHRVLEVLGSSLDRALSCTVFVNTEALSDFSEWDSVRAIVLAMLQTNCAASTNTVRGGGGEGGESEQSSDESEDESDAKLPQNIPVSVVGVSGLPRNARVEVEILGVKCGTIPHHLFSCVNHMLTHNSTPISSQSSGASVDFSGTAEDLVDSLPFWGAAGAPRETGMHSSHLIDKEQQYHSSVSVRQLIRCIAVGFCEVQQMSSSEDSLLDLHVAAEALILGVQKAFLSSQLSAKKHLRTLRVYYLPALVDCADLSVALSQYALLLLGTKPDFPVILIPVASLRENAVLSAQFIAVDFVQVETETWIYNGRN